jgi:hypothetical protein
MKRKLSRISMAIVATVMFAGALLLSLEQNKDGEWVFSAASAIAQGESGGGENGGGGNCLHIYEVYFEGVNIIPMQCCLTRHEYYLEYFECYIGECGVNNGVCGNMTVTTNTYIGVMCCA